jgi:hypothetical protein
MFHGADQEALSLWLMGQKMLRSVEPALVALGLLMSSLFYSGSFS